MKIKNVMFLIIAIFVFSTCAKAAPPAHAEKIDG